MTIKTILAALLAIFMFSACNNSSNKEASTASSAMQEADEKTNNNDMTVTKTIQLTRADFLEKVANFEENPDKWVYLGDKPAIIDFYADWCGPCKVIAPILEELAEEYEGEIYIYKVDTEAEQQLAAEFGIRSIPSLLFVPMGEDPQMA